MPLQNSAFPIKKQQKKQMSKWIIGSKWIDKIHKHQPASRYHNGCLKALWKKCRRAAQGDVMIIDPFARLGPLVKRLDLRNFGKNNWKVEKKKNWNIVCI